MMNFTPQDWIEIGSSLIASWYGCRFLFLMVCGMFGGETPQQIEVSVSGAVTVQQGDGDAE